MPATIASNGVAVGARQQTVSNLFEWVGVTIIASSRQTASMAGEERVG